MAAGLDAGLEAQVLNYEGTCRGPRLFRLHALRVGITHCD